MGVGALKSHAVGAKHNSKLKARERHTFSHTVPSTSSADSGSSSQPEKKSLTEKTLVTQATSETPTHPSTEAFTTKDRLLESEILWAFKTIMSHYCCSSNKNIGALFKRLFPDSPMAAQFSCDKTKSAYLLKYGLAPYFKNELVSKLADDDCLFTLSFDESFNKVLQKEQMDCW